MGIEDKSHGLRRPHEMGKTIGTCCPETRKEIQVEIDNKR